jgi:predicted transcriptional regulator of viral defense system
LRTSEAIELGIHPAKLYQLRDQGIIQELSWGVYQLAQVEFIHPDLIAVALKITQAVICLNSALAFYDLSAVIPHAVYIALPRNCSHPQMSWLPIRVFCSLEQLTVKGLRLRLSMG